MKTTWKIGAGCGMGSIFGLLIANIWASSWGVWGMVVGAIAGGTLSAIVYAYEEIIHFAPIAWKQVSGWKIPEINWSYVWHRIYFALKTGTAGLVTLWFGVILSALIIWTGSLKEGFSPYWSFISTTSGFAVVGFCLFFIFSITSTDKMFVSILEKDNIGVFFTFKWNVVTLPFTASFYILKGICIAVAWMWRNKTLSLLPLRFFWKLFVLVGLEGMECCFADTCVSVAIGWILQLRSPAELLVGGLIGVIIGVCHYEVVKSLPLAYKDALKDSYH